MQGDAQALRSAMHNLLDNAVSCGGTHVELMVQATEGGGWFVRVDDVITAVDGQPVQVSSDVSSRVGVAKPGERLNLALWRDKSRSELTVALGRAEPERGEPAAAAEGGTLGLAVRPLQRDELRGAGLDHGLLVEQVSGPAQLAGVQPGDVLLALNGKPVQRVEQVREALRAHPKSVALLVMRDGQQIFVPVSLG